MSARKFKLRCSKCYDKNIDKYEIDRCMGKIVAKNWYGVDAISKNDKGVLCRCRACGHEYISNAVAAYRRISSMEH